MANNQIFTYINGEYVPLAQASLPISDLSIQRGYGIFDFLLVRGGEPKFLDAHLQRFLKSAKILKLEMPHTAAELTTIVHALVDRNKIGNSSVKLILTGGVSADDFTPAGSTLLIVNKPFELNVAEALLHGTNLITSNYQREWPEAKSINYLRGVSLAGKMQAANALEVLYIHRNQVRECSRSNIFMVRNGILYTPKTHILKGITRKRILALEGFDICEKDFKSSDLLEADELFITSTTKGAMPVVRVDSRMISNGLPGPLTRKIQERINF